MVAKVVSTVVSTVCLWVSVVQRQELFGPQIRALVI